AAGAIVERERLQAAADRGAWAALPLIFVSDTRLALGKLAAYWRRQFALPLVALTGSSGKTTVKEMLAAILRAACGESAAVSEDESAVLATRGNLNNDIGVPLMLLRLTASHRYAVIEMGMNHAGEIRYLARLAAPDVALVNNAGRAHIEFLGSEEAIARAKGEIYEDLGAAGTAVINADDEHATLWRALAGIHRHLEFGLGAGDVTASYRLHPLGSEIVLHTPRGDASVKLAAPGLHNVHNALAAAAVAVALDVAPPAIAEGLSRFAGVKGRLQKRSSPQGATLIDDTYNANPDSVRAAIDVLAAVPGKRILVLGDMGELGGQGPRLHEEIGRYAKSSGVDALYGLGELAAGAVRAFGPGARHCATADEVLHALGSELGPDVTVLVKGSRFMRMERVADALSGDAPESNSRGHA
ncbi:MAG TPA: UDP-N-acetylmuramoyl-tripeptide--D-alanyl-D-alanine ligase, partial [Burkholderiales bacterium]